MSSKSWRHACWTREKLLQVLSETRRVLLQTFCAPELFTKVKKEIARKDTYEKMFAPRETPGDRRFGFHITPSRSQCVTPSTMTPRTTINLDEFEGKMMLDSIEKRGPEWWLYDTTIDLKRVNDRLYNEIRQHEYGTAEKREQSLRQSACLQVIETAIDPILTRFGKFKKRRLLANVHSSAEWDRDVETFPTDEELRIRHWIPPPSALAVDEEDEILEEVMDYRTYCWAIAKTYCWAIAISR